MDKFKAKKNRGSGPEAKIKADIIQILKINDWAVITTHGNMFQSGLPDLYACHRSYGARWIECKNPQAYSFTPAQLETFPMFASKGVGVWILTSGDESQYNLLFKPPNWYFFLSTMKI